jgi:teichoic acid transport system ATP-binding protein
MADPQRQMRDTEAVETGAAAATTHAIEVKDLSLSYVIYHERRRLQSAFRRQPRSAPIPALKDVSFTVERGEAFGIIGRNGAGKSTLLRVLAGMLLPDSGTVSINGKLSTLLALGAGFQPELSGEENIYMGALATGMTKKQVDERFDRIVEFAELGNAIRRPVKTYSSGMRARLAFAVGMSLDAEILLVDEVLSVGDEGFKDKSIEALTDLLDNAGTVVFVSHSLGTLARLCDRVMWLGQGEVRVIGESQDVVNRYKKWVKRAGIEE